MSAVVQWVVLLVVLSAAVGWVGGRASTAVERRALRQAATRDPLTGLANRAGLTGLVRQLAKRRRRMRLALLFIDLDGFKGVNDLYGHAVGDAVLVQAARRLRNCVRELGGRDAVAARLSGDEFIAVLALPDRPTDTEAIAEYAAAAVHLALCPTYSVPAVTGRGSCTAVVGASVGVALAGPSGDLDLDGLLVEADAAMYAAKRGGGGWFAVEVDGGSVSDADPAPLSSPSGAGGRPCATPSLNGRRPASTSLNRRGRVAGPFLDQHAEDRAAS